MIRQLTLAAAALVLLFGISRSQGQPGPDQQSIAPLLDSLGERLDWLTYRIEQEKYRRATTGESDSLAFFERFKLYLLSDRDTYQTLVSASAERPEDARRLDLLRGLMRESIVRASTSVYSLEDSVTSILDGYTFEFGGLTASAASLRKIMKEDANRVRREQAYRTLVAPSRATAGPMSRLFERRNEQAKLLGFDDYPSLLFAGESINLAQYEAMLAEIDQQTREPYGRLVARLQDKLQVQDFSPWDVGYAYQDVYRRVDPAFQADTLLDFVALSLSDIGFDIYDLPIYMEFVSDTAAPPLQMFAVQPPIDQRIYGQVRDGHRYEYDLLSRLGEALHCAHIRQEESLLNGRPTGPMKQAPAYFFGWFMAHPVWLQQYVGLSEQLASSLVRAYKDMALIHIRFLLAEQQFELAAYRRPGDDLNKLYWDIVTQYTLTPRLDDLRPWATDRQLVSHPFYVKDELIGQAIAAQTIAYLEKFGGSILRNRETRSFLVQNYFRFGRRYDWKELVSRGTGESLSLGALFDFLNME